MKDRNKCSLKDLSLAFEHRGSAAADCAYPRLLSCSLSGCIILALAGCSAGEAAVDGVYGGIADTVATLVSEALLSVAGR